MTSKAITSRKVRFHTAYSQIVSHLSLSKRSSSDALELRASKRQDNGRHSPISTAVYRPDAPPVWEALSEDIFRAILESAIEPKDGTPLSLADPVRLDMARKLCLISKTTARWIEPLLYRSVALASDKQIISFGYTLRRKCPEFLSQHVRALYIFYDNPIPDVLSGFSELFNAKHQDLDFSRLFSSLKGLEKLVLRGTWCMKVCDIRFPSPILDLTFINPPYSFEHFSLRLLSLRSFHIIDPPHDFARMSGEDGLDLPKTRSETLFTAAKLGAIQRICLDFTYTDSDLPGRFVNVLGRVLKGGDERFDLVNFSSVDVLGRMSRLMALYGQPDQRRQRSAGSPPSPISSTDDRGISRSLWVKINPFMKGQLKRPTDLFYENRSISWDSAAQTTKQVWERVADDYEQNGPSNCPACWESPLLEESEGRRFYDLCWLERMKYSIHYNELHWDRIAEECESGKAKGTEVLDGSST